MMKLLDGAKNVKRAITKYYIHHIIAPTITEYVNLLMVIKITGYENHLIIRKIGHVETIIIGTGLMIRIRVAFASMTKTGLKCMYIQAITKHTIRIITNILIVVGGSITTYIFVTSAKEENTWN